MAFMMVELEEKHLEDAATLAAARYRSLRSYAPLLPASYEDPASLLPLLRPMASSNAGMAALQDGRLVGFLTAWTMPDWRGRPTVYSPEWANGADESGSRRIYEELYAAMSARWVADGYFDHFVTLFAHDRPGIDAWQWLGFGYTVVDALRSVEPVGGGAQDVEVRRAASSDLPAVLDLWAALRRHLVAAPTFLVDAMHSNPKEDEGWLADPANAFWIAYRNGEPVASIGLGPASDDACTIIRDAGTTSIVHGFTHEHARGDGVATAVLDRALAWARDEGYVRCAVDFESMNSLAARFWTRHFQPVCYSLGRHVNPLIAGSK